MEGAKRIMQAGLLSIAMAALPALAAEQIKEVYAEAKGNGFDTKVLRKIVSIRKQDHNERMEQEALLELYMAALGMAAAPPQDDDE